MTSSSSDRWCCALDVGGTKIEAALVSDSGSIARRERIETRAHSPHLINDVFDLLERVSSDASPVAIGVGCGGPMRDSGRSVSPLNIPAWRDFDLAGALATRFGVPAHVDNDAKALALAEGTFGAARDCRNFVSMVVSTGVGGGIVLDGRLLDGSSGNAGHIGHIVVDPEGRPCACGSVGCLEAEASGTAIAAMTGHPAASADLAMRRRAGTMVGRAVASVAALLDVQRFFVAGSVALGFGDVFFDAANQEARQRARIEHARDVLVEPSSLGADGPILGAAQVAWSHA